jgi:hypothetical protein
MKKKDNLNFFLYKNSNKKNYLIANKFIVI